MKSFSDPRITKTIEWLQSKVKEAGARGLVVGVSGGIDSAVAANLIKEAFPESSLGLILPVRSQQRDVDDGVAVAEAAGLVYQVLDLSVFHQEMLEKVMKVLPNALEISELNQRMSDANLRARIRMNALYVAANAMNYLVVGTDNAAELYTGYFTKFGDGGVDLLPLGKLKKSEVYRWAEELGVPPQVLQRQPSAGLWDGQTDEDEMGITYALIDAYLSGEKVPDSAREKIGRMHEKTEHKRQMPPIPDW